jgi:cytochrome c biogenesis protein CcdA
MPAAIEVEDLWRTVVAALAAGVGVTVVFSLAIYGATRFADARRDDRPLASYAAATLAILALAAAVGSVVLGLIAMTEK